MSDVAVNLTETEIEIAAIVAAKRQASNLFKRRPDAHGARCEQGWSLHIEGACGEMAVAKWCGKYWNGAIGEMKADDVGKLQVRTRSNHTFDLIVHRDDPDKRAFVLVTGLAPNFILRGWIWGHEAKRDEWWKDPAGGRPAFFVPQSALRPMVKRSEAA